MSYRREWCVCAMGNRVTDSLPCSFSLSLPSLILSLQRLYIYILSSVYAFFHTYFGIWGFTSMVICDKIKLVQERSIRFTSTTEKNVLHQIVVYQPIALDSFLLRWFLLLLFCFIFQRVVCESASKVTLFNVTSSPWFDATWKKNDMQENVYDARYMHLSARVLLTLDVTHSFRENASSQKKIYWKCNENDRCIWLI